uniref:Uncharacterized protein n=1 Tax=Schistosoma curassoni TaxID=6186 RepID=A0A183JZY3_9TREM
MERRSGSIDKITHCLIILDFTFRLACKRTKFAWQVAHSPCKVKKPGLQSSFLLSIDSLFGRFLDSLEFVHSDKAELAAILRKFNA